MGTAIDGWEKKFAALRGLLDQGAPDELPARLASGERARASFAQRQLWFLHSLDPTCAAYHVPLDFTVRGTLDEALLRATLSSLLERHEALRARFTLVEGTLWQVPGDSEVPFSVIAPGEELAFFTAPFDLARGPLFRVAWLRGPEQRLLWCLHHIVCDAWSGEELCREFGALYTALATGRSLAARDGYTYRDYAEWQHRNWESGRLAGQLAYWKKKLQDVTPVTLPVTGERPATPTTRGAKTPFHLPPAAVSALRAVCREQGATLYMGLVAAFLCTLARHTGEEDLAIGSGIATREAAEWQDILGFFLNAIVLRTDLSGDPTFREVLRRVRQTTLEAYRNPDVPFEMLVEALHPARRTGQNPLFAVSLTLNEHRPKPIRVPGATLSTSDPNRLDLGRAKFDLAVHAWTEGDALAGVCEFSLDLYERPAIERFTRHFMALATHFAFSPGARLSAPDLLDVPDRALLARWNDTAVPNDFASVVRRFAGRAGRHPDSVAVVDERGSVDAATLDGLARRLAARLAERGVGRETPVGVCASHSLPLVVGFLASMKAGGCYLPLDPRQPAERLRQIVTEAEPAVIVTDEAHRALAASLGRPVLVADGPEWRAADRSEWRAADRSERRVADRSERRVAGAPAAELPDPRPDELAYLIYTSGSTGRPKGIAVEHRSFGHLVDFTIGHHGIGPADRAGLVTSIGFDPSVWELGTYLAAGATLFLGGEDLRISPVALQNWILDNELTVIYLAAPLLDGLLELPWPAHCALRMVFTGGDRLRAAPGKDIPFPILNLYGPAECTVNSTVGEIPRGASGSVTSNIGRPLANTRLHLLDRQGRPVPPGIVGEIHIDGIGLARGYYRNPELTAAAFLPNPFDPRPGSRLYRTGDLARWREDGTIHFVGRTDGQIKIRGMRVEVGEIEGVLRAHPGVHQALVVARKDERGSVTLIGYYRPVSEPVSDLKTFLRQHLPDAMVPAALIPLGEFPKTPNGKIDFRALPAIDAWTAPPALPGPLAEGWETRIAGVWREVLGVDAIGPETNFFDVGGHSLLLAVVQSRLAAWPGGDVRMLDLLRHTTVRGLARHLDGTSAGSEQERTESRQRADTRRERLAGLRARGRTRE